MSSSPRPSHMIIKDQWQTFGFVWKENRLVFQDSNQYGEFLKHQVKRWRPTKNQVEPKEEGKEKGVLLGIKIHSLAVHLLFKALYYLSFGKINKSIAIVLDGKTFYLNTNSLQTWRRLNHEALLALGVLKSTSHHDLAATRQLELSALNQLLKTPVNDRAPTKKIITECIDSFGVASLALQLAKSKVEGSCFTQGDKKKLDQATYAIAAFYILLTGKINTPACGQEVLEVSDHVKVQNCFAPEELLEKLAHADSKKLEGVELQLYNTIQVVYEDTPDGVKKRYLNISPDLFSSSFTRNNPVDAKKLLNELLKENEKFVLKFTDLLLGAIVNGNQIQAGPLERKFFTHILSLGQALKDQFTPVDPALQLKNLFQSSFIQITPVINKKNQFNPKLFKQLGTLSAWNLLKNTPEINGHNDGSKTLTYVVEEPHMISLHFPSKHFYEDIQCKKPASICFVNSLAGHLPCDGLDAPLCFNEVLEFAQKYQELWAEEKIVLEELVHRLTLNPPEGEEGHKPPAGIIKATWEELSSETSTQLSKRFSSAWNQRYREYNRKITYDKKAFDQLVLLYEKLEQVGLLIYNRYLRNILGEFLGKLKFEKGGAVTLKPELLVKAALTKRTAEEHKRITGTYFPGYQIPRLIRKEPPQLRQQEIERTSPKLYRSSLFEKLENHSGSVARGSCGVGALAQGIFNKQSASKDIQVLKAIRNAACNYMKKYPEQFFNEVELTPEIHRLTRLENPSEGDKNILNQLLKKRVIHFANSLTGEAWFTSAAIKAISYIIGRPIYIINEHDGVVHQLDDSGAIELEKINPHFDGGILYLNLFTDTLNNGHYHCLMPKREGTQDI